MKVNVLLNLLKTSPKYTQAGVCGKRVLQQIQIVFHGLMHFFINLGRVTT